MRILLTGASGFVGSAVLAEAMRRNVDILPVFRSLEKARAITNTDAGYHIEPSQMAQTNWSDALKRIDVVIHCAGLLSVSSREGVDRLKAFRSVNVDGTLNLARQAAAAGVKRFVFLSTIKVNGEATQVGKPYSARDLPLPSDSYAISKAEAESNLRNLSINSGMEFVIIRPPLVYGPSAKGNFYSLLRLVYSGFPLPLASAKSNRRSLVGIGNLVDLILTCVNHPKAANQILLVSDGEDQSTVDVIRKIARLINRPARLFPFPLIIIHCIAYLVGMKSIAMRLFGSLQIDISDTCALLDWAPPFTMDEELSKIQE